MIAVVTKKDEFAADLFLQPASGCNLSEEEPLGKKSARLLAETNNRMIHGSERASYARGCFRAAKESLLQNRRDDQYDRAPNKVVPQVTDVRCSEQNEHQGLCKERREKHGRSGNSTNKERRQKKTQDTAIENGAQNVACFDEVLDQTGERRYADCD